MPNPCHAKRTLSNVKMYDSPHLARGSTAQRLPNCGHASGTPRLPREIHVRHPLDTHIIHHLPRLPHETPTLDPAPRIRCHDSPRLPRETSIRTREATCSRHAELHRSIATPKRTRCGRRRSLAHTRRKRVKHGPAPRPHLKTITLCYAFGKNTHIFRVHPLQLQASVAGLDCTEHLHQALPATTLCGRG